MDIQLKTILKLTTLFSILATASISTHAQSEIIDTVFVCKNTCTKIGVKSKKGYTYDWRAFGRNIESNNSKIEICPKKTNDLYYAKIYDKNNELLVTRMYKIFLREKEINIIPENPCVAEKTKLELEVVENFKKYLWSNGKKGKKISVSDRNSISVKVQDEDGCYHEKNISITIQSNKDIEKELLDAGFISFPVKIKSKKKGNN